MNFNGTTGGIFSSDPGLTLDPSTGDIDLGTSSTGTYIVVYTIAASGGCDVYFTGTSITINKTPFAAISYNNSSYCTNAGNVGVNLIGDAGGTFSSSDGLSIDPNKGLINCQASTPGTYVVNYVLNNNCGSYTASTTVSIEAAPLASISYDNSPYCTGGGTASVTFNGNNGGT